MWALFLASEDTRSSCIIINLCARPLPKSGRTCLVLFGPKERKGFPIILMEHRYAVFALYVMDNVGFVFGLRRCTCSTYIIISLCS